MKNLQFSLRTMIGLIITLFAMMAWTGCGSGSNSTDPNLIVYPLMGGTPVTDNLIPTMSWAQVQAIPINTVCQARFNRGPVVAIPVHLLSSLTENGERLIVFQLPNTAVAVHGDSGSQISLNGKVIGGLCYVFVADQNQFIARYIGDITDVGSRGQVAYRSEGTINGRAFKALDLAEYRGQIDSKQTTTREGRITEPSIAGMNVMVTESYGNYCTGMSGTITYVDASGNIWAFSHQYHLNGGNCAKPIFLCQFIAVKFDRLGSQKLVRPFYTIYDQEKIGVPFGTMTDDRFSGIKIKPRGTPDVVSCRTSVPDSGFAWNSFVSIDTNKDFESTTIANALTYGVFTNLGSEPDCKGTVTGTLTIDGAAPIDISASSASNVIADYKNMVYKAVRANIPISSVRLDITSLTTKYTPPTP